MYDDQEMTASDKRRGCFCVCFFVVAMVAIGLSVGIIVMAIFDSVSYAIGGM